MKTTFKALAIASLMGTVAAPAFAGGHLQLSSMTCEEYNGLGGADRDAVAVMAIAAMNDNVDPGDGTATATASSVGTSATESESSTTVASNNGTATATSTAGADDDLSRYAEEIRVMNRVCSRNWDAMVTEAAAGQAGTR